MIKHINVYKILISLLYYQLLNSNLILKYNITNSLNLTLDNYKINITFKILNNNDFKKTKPIDIGNNKKNIKLANINK